MAIAHPKIIAFLPVLLLIGCGGGGTSEPLETPYDQISGAYSQLARENDINNLTPLDNMPRGPDAGSAAYSGYVMLSVANAPISDIAGDIQVNVDFETTGVSGHASGFYSDDGVELTVVDTNADPSLTNEIPFTGGFNMDNRPDYPISFDLIGNLMTNEGTVIGIDVAMNGDFLGSDASAVGGSAAGEATVNDAITGPVVGTFLAVQ
ncbi:hypothetical protein C7964_102960 [Loktanella sp. PT4BL]|jgi:hypothetical protein|uniref:hypothetical protein n=1 Tax=Loktanella sp. PT4BL TaxID=2135611 RepID=UPI000D7734F9|nr:hypothetical protein [Loktanella sp. PT4BL]PXW71058.1 hypothetical protein C7964_102960 [Loktanella sp. PT4BL]